MRDAKISKKALKASHRAELGQCNGYKCAEQGNANKVRRCQSGADTHAFPRKLAQLCHRVRRQANIALAASLSVMGAGPAIAEGVVLQSTSEAYPRGAIVASGEALHLAAGESLTILDKSGAIEVFDAPGQYGSDATSPGEREIDRDFPIVEAAIWDRQRAEIGGTREFDFSACVEAAETRDDLTLADCERTRAHIEAGPQLELGFTGYAATRKPGEALHLSLKTNFEARVACQMASEQGEAHHRTLGIGHRGEADYHLRKNLVVFVPMRGTPAIKAPDTPGQYAIRCKAVDADTASTFEEVADPWLNEPTERAEVLETFARLRGAPTVSAELTLSVQER